MQTGLKNEFFSSIKMEFFQNCNNYKGIKLLSHTMKVWERWWRRVRRNMFISENQFDFMPGRSITKAITLFSPYPACEITITVGWYDVIVIIKTVESPRHKIILLRWQSPKDFRNRYHFWIPLYKFLLPPLSMFNQVLFHYHHMRDSNNITYSL